MLDTLYLIVIWLPAKLMKRLLLGSNILLLGCCGVLLWFNHSLLEHNHLLNQQFESLAAADGPPVGSSISVLRGEGVHGGEDALDLSRSKEDTLLLVLSPKCNYTKLNFNNWRLILGRVAPKQVIYVDITRSVDMAYLASVGIPADANVVKLDAEERTLYSLRATPTTVLLGPQGIVKGVWVGLLGAEQTKQIQGMLQAVYVSISQSN